MNNSVYILEDRSIIYINGEDAKNFLQNLISNDINKVTENSSCFASLLTPQGKFLFEFLIIKHKSGYFIDCEKTQSNEIFKQLNLYKIRSKVEILNLSNEFVVVVWKNIYLWKGRRILWVIPSNIEKTQLFWTLEINLWELD